VSAIDLLDWTQTVGELNALVAAVPSVGRAIPIHAEVHSASEPGDREVQQRFPERLATVLPKDAEPVIVADAGFRTPVFKTVIELDWDFVMRLRGNRVLKQWGTALRQRDRRLPCMAAWAMAIDGATDRRSCHCSEVSPSLCCARLELRWRGWRGRRPFRIIDDRG